MAITRADVEKVLIRRVGKTLTECGLDGATNDGSNADLVDPIGYALRFLGITPASIAGVEDADLVTVADVQADALLDVSEWRVLQSALSNYTAVDFSVGPRSEKYDQLRAGIEAAIKRKSDYITATHGAGAMAVSGGSGLEQGTLRFEV